MKKRLSTLLVTVMSVFTASVYAQVSPDNVEREHTTQEMTIKPNYKNIIGYYASWEQYKRGGLCIPENINWSKYTIINYSFFQCDKDGNIFGTDSWGDSILLRGRYDYGNPVQPAYYPNTNLVDLAHVAGAKVMVSIGGWTLSETFPTVAADPKKRANFAHNCIRTLHNYGFDGIDIDWEFPGYVEHKGTPDDKKNFTLLMQAIRDSIDSYGEKVNQKMLLTAAFGNHPTQTSQIEWDKIVKIMDYINMMTYDFNGSWSEVNSHNAPLYKPAKGDTTTLDNCFRSLRDKYKVPPSMINLGVPFYGRTLIGKPGVKLDLFGTQHTGAIDTITFVPDIGGALYYNILLQKDKFDEKWDDNAQVPYLVGKGDLNTFVSFDNPKSIKIKAEYVNKNEAAGVIIWELTGDYSEKAPGGGIVGETPLIDALNEVLRTPKKRAIPRRWRDPVAKVEKEKGWRAKAIMQNLKNIYQTEEIKSAETNK